MRALYHGRAILRGMIALAVALLAGLLHHSFAMFDTTKPVTLVGTVTAFEWTNPHAYIELDVPGEAGAIKHWSIELCSPSTLQQAGWKFKVLKLSDKVTAVSSPPKTDQTWPRQFSVPL